MVVQVNDPFSGRFLQLTATPESKEGVQGWRIRFPYKFSFLMVWQNGQWQVWDDMNIHPELVEALQQQLYPVPQQKAGSKNTEPEFVS